MGNPGPDGVRHLISPCGWKRCNIYISLSRSLTSNNDDVSIIKSTRKPLLAAIAHVVVRATTGWLCIYRRAVMTYWVVMLFNISSTLQLDDQHR